MFFRFEENTPIVTLSINGVDKISYEMKKNSKYTDTVGIWVADYATKIMFQVHDQTCAADNLLHAIQIIAGSLQHFNITEEIVAYIWKELVMCEHDIVRAFKFSSLRKVMKDVIKDFPALNVEDIINPDDDPL